MILFTANNTAYGIKFSHSQEGGFTTCWIFRILVDDEHDDRFIKDPLARGDALLHPKDKYSRPVGRKLTLQRALDKMNTTREVRTAAWNAVFAQCKKV